MATTSTAAKIGPWFATPTSGAYAHVSSKPTDAPDDGGDIAIVWGFRGDAREYARLIAAAPELLDVLKTIQSKMADFVHLANYVGINDADGVYLGHAMEVEQEARAAISKATGGAS